MPNPHGQTSGTAPIDPARAQLVDAARTAWIGRLIDLSRRNNLLFYRPIPTSSIDLTIQNPGLLELLAGRSVTGETLMPDPSVRSGRILAIARKAQENSEEKGLQTLYLAIGFAGWQSNDGGRDPQAPVFLVPLQMKRKGKELASIEVQVAGEPLVNPVLLHILAEQTGIQIPESELIEAGLLETLLYHLQRRPLLGDKKNSLPASHKCRDQICDGLAFAGSWRSVNDCVLPHRDTGDGALLARIRLHHTEVLIWRLVIEASRVNGDLSRSEATTR